MSPEILHYVRPRFSAINEENVSARNSVGSPYLFSRHFSFRFKPSYFSNIILSQVRVIMRFSALKIGWVVCRSVCRSSWNSFGFCFCRFPALSKHVLRVILFSSSEQVKWSYARWIVAMMQSAKLLRNAAIFNDDRNSTCQVSNISNSVCAVSFRISTSRPNPAWTEFWPVLRERPLFIHLVPKTGLVFFGQLRDWSCSHIENSLSWLVSVFGMLNTSREREIFYLKTAFRQYLMESLAKRP